MSSRVDGCSVPSTIKDIHVSDCFDSIFADGCELHDRCYNTPGSSKKHCDSVFWNTMDAICSNFGNSLLCGGWGTCEAAAGVYYEAVSLGGEDSYNGDQKWAGKNCQEDYWSNPEKESDSKLTCDSGFAMAGRWHQRDENGYTQYYCRQPEESNLGDYDDLNWKDAGNESDSDFRCPTDKIMVGRKHSGDENGATHYKCIALPDDGTLLADESNSGHIKESSGKEFVCPESKVMIARKHSGDENGDTTYYCASIKEGQPVTVTDQKWSNEQKESDSKYTCNQDYIMIGRKHSGDENGDTKYRCAKFAGFEFGSYDNLDWASAGEETKADYSCPSGKVMVGRKHKGDENAKTYYKCISVPAGTTLENEYTSDQIKESAGTSFTCPDNRVLVGRKHNGDENGNTRYTCKSLAPQ